MNFLNWINWINWFDSPTSNLSSPVHRTYGPYYNKVKLVVQELLRRPDHQAERQEILKKYWGQFDAYYELGQIAETLKDAKIITIKRNNQYEGDRFVSTSIVYVLTQDALDQYAKYKSEVN